MRGHPVLLVATSVLLSPVLGRVAPLAAQDASAYVSLEHWATPYLEYLIARGIIADPSPLTRPFSQTDVVRVLTEADSTRLNGPERRMVRLILSELSIPKTDGKPWGRADGDVAASGASQARRDPLRDAGPGHATASGGIAAQVLLGPLAAVTHPYFDTRLKYDPDYQGKKDRFVAGRNAEAYVDARWRFGELFFGSVDRNWGPPALEGLLVSPSPYSYDHLGMVLGTRRLQLQAIVTELDDLPDTSGALNHRYFVAHRLLWRPGRATTLGFWEGEIAAGPGRNLEPWFANILNLGLLVEYDRQINVNSLLGLDFEARLHGTKVFAQVLLDDIQIDRRTKADSEPPSYGFTLGVERPVRAVVLTAYYTQVANLTYRTPNPAEAVESRLVGLGRNFSDYDQVTMRASALIGPGILLQPEATVLRQGQGDFRLPYPAVAAYGSTPTLFAGVVERTVRLALGGTWQRGAWGFSGNGGVHFLHNAGHVSGASETKWVGGVTLAYRFHIQGALP
ncbi:MAG: hypothetical protein DMD33_16065 [Gemmatimonadetes bacterium]|nr:MAG: hypothetical protein DMD33_16065 [Gemmatimonadota bacterium]